MLPTWLDIQIHAEYTRERAEKTAKAYHILRMQREAKGRSIDHRIVQFGAWLERLGCRLQSRYARHPNMEIRMTSVCDAGLQSC
jgi:hypothetical protein